MGNCLFNGVPDEAAVSKDVTDIIEVVAPNGAASASPEVIWRYSGSGVWKVKLVISAAELAEILAEDSRTEELIESVRTVAKGGGRKKNSISGGNGVVSEDCRDELSGSNSRKVGQVGNLY